MSAAEVIAKILAAGFTLAVDGADLVVNPPGKLSDQQRQFLKLHKPEIIAALSQPGTMLDSDQGGHDLEPANDPSDRVTVRVPSLTLADGKKVACDLSVPASRLPELDKVLKVERKLPSALPPELVCAALASCKAYGDSKAAQDELLEDLTLYPPEEYPALVEHFRSKLNKVRCVDCMHSDITAGIARCRAGVDSKLPIQGRWATDAHICPWHFKSRDSPETVNNRGNNSVIA